MRRGLVLATAALLVLVPQIKEAAARGGHGGGFHGGGFHAGTGFGGFRGSFARAGLAPGFAGVHPGWRGGGVRWAGGWSPGWGRPGWGWRTGWNPWIAHRPAWRWAAAGALGFAAYNTFSYDCPLTRRAIWDGFGYRVIWTRSCDYFW